MNYTHLGGGVSGASTRASTCSVWGVKCRKGLGGKSPHVPDTKVNSNFASSFCRSCWCSVALPALTILQSLHGYFPLKVFSSATATVSFWENFAAMLIHAADCSNAQCPPIIRTSDNTTSHLPRRRSTGAVCAAGERLSNAAIEVLPVGAGHTHHGKPQCSR